MHALIETYHRLLAAQGDIYIRQFFHEFVFDGRMNGIVGPRGVGKTTFLLYYLAKNYATSEEALYVSADNLYFVEHSLVSLVDQFVKEYNGRFLVIDEVHKYKNWNQELKNIHDSYPKIQILFSGSSSIDLVKGKFDLSRRALLHHLHGFSFREYLEFTLNIKLKSYSLQDLIKHHFKIAEDLSAIPKLLGHFKTYLQRGYYPFSHHYREIKNFTQTVMSIVDKIIYEDVASFYSLKTPNLEVLKKILYFVATSKPGTLNINKLAQSLSKDHSTMAEYLQILRDTGLLLFLMNEKSGHALIRNAEKIYLDNPNLLFAITDSLGKSADLGSMREQFIISQVCHAGAIPLYTQTGDFQCEQFTFEVGGKNKGSFQIRGITDAFVVKDDILLGDKTTLPLYLFGFLSGSV